jgi:hypothetical protein
MLSHNNLDVIAWYIFIRSGFIESIEHDTFDTSEWARSVIHNFTKMFVSDSFNLRESDIDRYGFYSEICKILESGNFHDLDNYIYSCIKRNVKSTSDNIPSELKIAIELYENNGNLCPHMIRPNKKLLKCGLQELMDTNMDTVIIDELMREYINLDESVYAAVSGDGCEIVMQELATALMDFFEIIHMASVPVTETGKRQWVRLQYAHESHWDENNMLSYMHHKAHGVRIPGSSIGVIFVKKKKIYRNIRVLKEEVRSALKSNTKFNNKGIDPHIHFPDTNLEVKWIANTVLNRNSIEWINNTCDIHPKYFSVLIQEYKKEMLLRKDNTNFCLDTGAVMAFYGVRDTNDIDFISIGNSEKAIVNERLESHNSQYNGYSIAVREIIENPKYHFHYKHIKSSTLCTVKSFKKYRSEISPGSINSIKDLTDVKKIEEFLKNNTKSTLINDYDTSAQFPLNDRLYKEAKLFTKLHFFKHDFLFVLVKTVQICTPRIMHKYLKNIFYKFLRVIAQITKKKKVITRIQNTLG